MKIAVIGTVGIPAKYGGFETLAEQLVRSTASCQYIVYCSTKAYSEYPEQYLSAKLHYIPLQANGMQSILYDIWSIFHALFKGYRTLLILGVSGAIVLPFVKFFFPKRRIVVNIDGLEWKRDKWSPKAKKFLRFSEGIAIKYADHTITDNKAIQEYVKETYCKETSLIEYGADHIGKGPVQRTGNYAFSVCRIEPENNIHVFVEAFSTMPEQQLKIVGNWNASEYGRELRSKYAGYSNITLMDPIYDNLALNELRANCAVYLHGHSAGGTNPSLVEAMYLGLPIVAFDVSYNRFTTEDKAVYFKNADSLKAVVQTITQEQKDEVAKAMYEIALKRYTWGIISQKYEALF